MACQNKHSDVAIKLIEAGAKIDAIGPVWINTVVDMLYIAIAHISTTEVHVFKSTLFCMYLK